MCIERIGQQGRTRAQSAGQNVEKQVPIGRIDVLKRPALENLLNYRLRCIPYRL